MLIFKVRERERATRLEPMPPFGRLLDFGDEQKRMVGLYSARIISHETIPAVLPFMIKGTSR